MTLGQKIRAARLERGLTQKQVVGSQITRNMLSKIENDSATPSVRTLEYLAQALGLPISYFLSGTKYSDGSSADGLDKMRAAYKSGDYKLCLQLLDAHKAPATTDEGYLLYARASAALARERFLCGDVAGAREFADSADYYNKEGLYYSADLDAEMSLLLCECSLLLRDGDFAANEKEFLRADKLIAYTGRFLLDKATNLIDHGQLEEASSLLDRPECGLPRYAAQQKFVLGSLHLAQGNYAAAIPPLLEAEALSDENRPLLGAVCGKLEICYREQGNFEKAYYYAAKQLR